VQLKVILGDGRLKIKEAPANYYQVIVLDAFSSDAIPVHLLTRQAFFNFESRAIFRLDRLRRFDGMRLYRTK